jgi:hypothetical protein
MHIRPVENMAATPNFFAMSHLRLDMAIIGRTKMCTSDVRMNDAVVTQSLKVLRYRGPAKDSTQPWPGGGEMMTIRAILVAIYHSQTSASPT